MPECQHTTVALGNETLSLNVRPANVFEDNDERMQDSLISEAFYAELTDPAIPNQTSNHEETQTDLYPVWMMPEETVFVCAKPDFEDRYGLGTPLTQSVEVSLAEAMSSDKDDQSDELDQDANGFDVDSRTSKEMSPLFLDDAQRNNSYVTEIADIRVYATTGSVVTTVGPEGGTC